MLAQLKGEAVLGDSGWEKERGCCQLKRMHHAQLVGQRSGVASTRGQLSGHAPVKRRHGRLERRELWALADPELNGYVGSAGTVGEAWPHLQQVCRLERQRVVKGKKQVAVSYQVTTGLSRGHWGIENRLHWVRDVTFDEDRSQVRTGAAPQVLAGLRNLVISLVRRAGHSNVAAALRRHNAHLSEAFDMMGFTYQAGE